MDSFWGWNFRLCQGGDHNNLISHVIVNKFCPSDRSKSDKAPPRLIPGGDKADAVDDGRFTRLSH